MFMLDIIAEVPQLTVPRDASVPIIRDSIDGSSCAKVWIHVCRIPRWRFSGHPDEGRIEGAHLATWSQD
jgi:hypothetical protein